VVEETKKQYPPDFEKATIVPFNGITDRSAANFLGDVLMSRMIDSPGYINNEPAKSALAILEMADEMGLPEGGWRSQQARGIRLSDVTVAFLQGRLRVTPAPQQKA
jgi:hypothetical protein